jgi:hypothetical protein
LAGVMRVGPVTLQWSMEWFGLSRTATPPHATAPKHAHTWDSRAQGRLWTLGRLQTKGSPPVREARCGRRAQ